MQKTKTVKKSVTISILVLALMITSIVNGFFANGNLKTANAAGTVTTSFTLCEEIGKVAYTDEELANSGWNGTSRDANKRALFETAFSKSQLKYFVAPYQTGYAQREFYTWSNDVNSWYLSYTSINGLCAGNSGTTGNGLSTVASGYTIYSGDNKLTWSIAFVAPSDGVLVIPETTLSVGWFGGGATAFQLGWSSDNGNRATMSATDSSLNWNTYTTGTYTIKEQTYNLKAGQTVYLNMYTAGASTNNIKYDPTFNFTTTKYEVGKETLTLTEEIAKIGYTEEEKTASGWNGSSRDANKKALYQTAFAKSDLKFYAGAHTGSVNSYQFLEYADWADNGNTWKWSATSINGLGVGNNLYGSDAPLFSTTGTHFIYRPRTGGATDYGWCYAIAWTAPISGTLTIPETTLTINSFTDATLMMAITQGDYLLPHEEGWTEYNEVKTYTLSKQTYQVIEGDIVYINFYSKGVDSDKDGVSITYNPQFVFEESKVQKTTLSAEISKVSYSNDELTNSGWDGSYSVNLSTDALLAKQALLQTAFSKSDFKFYIGLGTSSSYSVVEYWDATDTGRYGCSYGSINGVSAGHHKGTEYGLHGNGLDHGIGGSGDYSHTLIVEYTAKMDGKLTIPSHSLVIDSFGNQATALKISYTVDNYMIPYSGNQNWITYDTTGTYTVEEQSFNLKAGQTVYLNMYADGNTGSRKIIVDYNPEFVFEPAEIPAEGEFVGATISTASDLSVNFYANVHTAGSVKATAVCGETTKTLTGIYDAFVNAWKFAYPVPAKDYDKDITVTISEIDGVKISNGATTTYSVKDYIDYVKADTTGAYDNVKDLVLSVEEYCISAQKYFANEVVEKVENGITASDLIEYANSVEGEDENITLQGATLILESKTVINVYFTANGEFTCLVNGNSVTATKVEGFDNLYVVSVEVLAKDLSVMQAIQIGGYTVNYSAYSYIETCVDTASNGLYNVLQALYNYGENAQAYFGK